MHTGSTVRDGISQVRYSHAGKDEEAYLELHYTVRLAQAPLPDSGGVAIRAACQVGSDRLVEVGPPQGRLVQGTAVEIEDSAFLLHPLPETPSMCDLEFIEASFKDPRSIGHACITDHVELAPCPPNRVADDGVGPTGITVVLTSVKGEDADSIGFPAHLTVAYKVTAHRDMPRGGYLVRRTSCPGARASDTWHSDLEHLRAGDSFVAAQNTYELGRPAPGTPCETSFGFSPRVNGPITEIRKLCHRDEKITHAPCP
jgi:hypothetical protein